MMRLIYAKRNTFISIFPNTCATVSLEPQSEALEGNIVNRVEAIRVGYLSVADAEAQTGISRWTWRRWAYDGKVGSVKLGRRLLIPLAEIERLVAENTRPALEQR
jgi:excisionase family DNA binding protein